MQIVKSAHHVSTGVIRQNTVWNHLNKAVYKMKFEYLIAMQLFDMPQRCANVSY